MEARSGRLSPQASGSRRLSSRRALALFSASTNPAEPKGRQRRSGKPPCSASETRRMARQPPRLNSRHCSSSSARSTPLLRWLKRAPSSNELGTSALRCKRRLKLWRSRVPSRRRPEQRRCQMRARSLRAKKRPLRPLKPKLAGKTANTCRGLSAQASKAAQQW